MNCPFEFHRLPILVITVKLRCVPPMYAAVHIRRHGSTYLRAEPGCLAAVPVAMRMINMRDHRRCCAVVLDSGIKSPGRNANSTVNTASSVAGRRLVPGAPFRTKLFTPNLGDVVSRR
jgi:hypothetical protein